MATLPDGPEVAAAPAALPPDVDQLFPEQQKSVDELFPVDVEKNRYRRQTLGTSPIQDLIFGNSEVNPAARVLDAFGQGFKHGWGSEPAGLSKESVDYLKSAGVFNDYDKGQKSIIKAANESLFRGAAMYVVDPVMRGLPGLFGGTQATVAKIGEEVGQEKLGREAAGAFEAFPSGFRAPTGIPHAAPHPMLAEIERAKSLGVIGEGEAGYFGTKPAEVTAPVSGPQEAASPAKPAGMPVDLFETPRTETTLSIRGTDFSGPLKDQAEVAPGSPEPGLPAVDTGPGPRSIADDVTQKLIAAGRPEAEAQASAELIASHYEARAERFKGERGTAEEMYKADGAEIRSGDGAAPAKSEAIRPAPEGDAAAIEAQPKPLPGDAGAAATIDTVPELKKALRGRAGADPQTWSLYEFLAKEGGLKPTADLHSIMGGKNPFIPGFGPLLRKGGLTMDEALTRAKENAYILDPNDIQHTPGAANTGELTKSVNDLHDMIAEESRGRKNYRNDHTPKEKPVNPDEERNSILDALHRDVEAATGRKPSIDPAIEDRVVEIIQKEGVHDVHAAFERAIMEDHDRHEGLLDERRGTHGPIEGHDVVSETASGAGKEFVDDSGYTWASEQEAREANVSASRDYGTHDRAAAESLTASQLWDQFATDRQGRRETADIQTGYNPETSKSGAQLRGKKSQVWEPGNTVDVGLVKNLLIAEKNADGSFTLLLKPNEAGISRRYSFKQHEGISRDGEVDFREATKSLVQDRELELNQIKRGKINLRKDAKPIITLFKDANASTFVHETGHHWLEELMADAEHPKAPTDLKADAIAVLDWLGVKGEKAPPPKPGMIRFYHGTAYKDASEFTGKTFVTPHEQYARDYHGGPNNVLYMDLTKAEADARGLIDEVNRYPIHGPIDDGASRLQPLEKAGQIKTSHHEKFARGFERYMMEGKAPNQELAGVFAHFRNWLTKIYQTVTRLKSPINDEIRGVFDRLLTMHPSEVRIEPEGPPKTFADIHEADAVHTAPEASHPVAETIQAERDMLAAEHIPEEHDARLDGVTSKADRREAGGPQPFRDVNEAGPVAKEGGNDQATGAVSEGGSNAPAESARPSVGGGKTEPPVSSQSTFTGPDSALVDKAGNIRIDNLGTAEDVNKAIRDAAAENNEFIDARRGVVTDGQVLELADALGMDAGQLNTRKLGQAYNAEQIMAARKLLIQSATTVRDAMVRAAKGAEADIVAYAEAKARHQMIQEQVSGITAEAGRALRAFRKLEGQQEAGQIDAFLKDATGKTLFQLQREAQLGSQLATPAEVSKFVNDASKPTWKDKIFELWISFLLSGPKTHAANMIGNTISGLLRPVETAIASGYGKAFSAFGKQDRVLFGEATAELFGAFQGSREGIVAAYKAYKTEEPQLTSVNQIERGHQKGLPSATVNVLGREMEVGGKQVRIPLRLLGAEDEFFKATSFRGSINRQAYELAAKENLPPEQFNVRVAELSMNPTEEMVNKAKDAADYLAFQKPLGDTGRKAQNFINSHIALKFIVPFVRTPINLLKYAGERTPLGIFSAEVRDNLSGKNGAVARDTQLARITLGTMVGVAAFSLANEGLITGGGPTDPSKRAVMQQDGWQPYSVKIGGMYYAYNRLDPFSIIAGVVADAHEIYTASNSTHADKEHLASLLFAAITRNITDRASLKGPSDLIQAVTNNERYGKSYVNGMVGTVVPAFFAQSAQAIDPTVREARTLIDYLKARTPFLSETLHPKRDVWGEPMVREGGLGPDIGSPIMEKRIKNDPVNQALIAANYFPAKLDRKIRGIELNDQQYDDFARIAGRMAKVRLNAIVNIPGFAQMPETARKELMTSAITTSREASRSLIMMQNPEIIKKAMDAKIAKVRGTEAAH